MADYGVYASLDVLKAELGISDTAEDARLLRALASASRRIDDHCHRHFFCKEATRYYSAVETGRLLLPDDLLSITTLRTDEDGLRAYGTTWGATDYDLEPANEYPKWRVVTAPNGSHTFPAGVARGVEIVGLWGYGDGESASPWSALSVTATVATAAGTTVTTSDDEGLAIGQTWLVESEQMHVVAGSATTWTVIRGVNGTTAAAHAAKAIAIARYPAPIVNACARTAARIYRLQSAPFGVTGSADMGTQEVPTRFDMDVFQDLSPYVKLLGV